jgi:hypothetical protein
VGSPFQEATTPGPYLEKHTWYNKPAERHETTDFTAIKSCCIKVPSNCKWNFQLVLYTDLHLMTCPKELSILLYFLCARIQGEKKSRMADQPKLQVLLQPYRAEPSFSRKQQIC